MKRVLFLMIMVVVALWAAASDRLYIENFSIAPGETKQVSIILENETQYTAFQTDIYLPEGLTVEKEDDEYAFELTSRKSRDHIIMGQDRPDGAIRLMSYSMQVNPFSGNSGELVTFDITASEDFYNDAVIELKHSLFTTLYDQEVSFSNESCKVQPILKDLTGEILITGGGDKKSIWFEDSGVYDIYRDFYISYTGDEDVVFSIIVNDIDVINNEYYSPCCSWEEQLNCYIVGLSGYFLFSCGMNDQVYYNNYKKLLGYDIYVTVQAAGYKSKSSDYYTLYADYVPAARPSIEGTLTDLALIIDVGYAYSVHYCNLDGVYTNYYGNEEDEDSNMHDPLYIIERLNHDFYITVFAANRTLMSEGYGYREETFFVPARKEIYISLYEGNEEELGYHYLTLDSINYSINYSINSQEINELIVDVGGGERLGNNYAIIKFDGDGADNYIGRIHFSVNGRSIGEYWTEGWEYYEHSFSINLLPYGDAFGGDYHVQATVTTWPDLSMPTDTVLEYHPIETRLYPDSLIIDVNPGIRNAILLVNGEEVELSADEQGQELLYALERSDEDYSITVQVGNKIRPYDQEEEIPVLSQETTIVVPAKHLSDLSGEIQITEGEYLATLMGDDDEHSGIFDLYGCLYVSYTGEEDVEFSISFNDIDILNDDYFSNCANWDEENNRYVIDLFGLFYMTCQDDFDFMERIDYFVFDVSVNSAGYNSISSNYETLYAGYFPECPPSIMVEDQNDLAIVIGVIYDSDYSIRYCNLADTYQNHGNSNHSKYHIERLDHDYSITVIAGQKSLFGNVYSCSEETILIPAKDSEDVNGDMNGDGILDVSDVTALIAYVLSNSDSGSNKNADLNNDGIVDVSDVTLLISRVLSN